MDEKNLPSMEPVEETTPVERPKDPHFPYTLIILAGIMAILNGILLLSLDFQHIQEVQIEAGSVQNTLDIIAWIAPVEIFLGLATVILGFIARKTGKALGFVAAALSIISLGPLMLSSILGVISVILLRRYQNPV